MDYIHHTRRTTTFRIGKFNIIYIIIAINLINYMINASLLIRMSTIVTRITGIITLMLRLVSILLCIFQLISKKTKLLELGFFVLFLFIVLEEYKCLGIWLFFDVLFIPFFFRNNVKFEKIRKIYLWILIGSVICFSLLSITGIFSEYNFVRGDERIRYSLGFSHPNTLGNVVAAVCFLMTLRDSRKVYKRDYLIIALCALFLWIVPNSMTSAVLLLGFIFVLFVYDLKSGKNNAKPLKKWAYHLRLSLVFVLLVVSAYILYGIMFKSWGMATISSISGTLYTRFIYGRRAFIEYGTCLFGNPSIDFVGELDILSGKALANEYFALDCLYVYLPVVIGIIPTILFAIAYFTGIARSIRLKHFLVFGILMLYLLGSLSDSVLVSPMLGWVYFWIYTADTSVTIKKEVRI